MYIHEHTNWPQFTWISERVSTRLAEIRYKQGKLLGKMETLGFSMREEAVLETLTLDVLKSSEIEGEMLDAAQVRSSIAKHLGIDLAGAVIVDRNVEGVVEMMLDATQHYAQPLTAERLFGWQAALFPAGRSGLYKITTGAWRTGENGPMQVVSGAIGKETVHFQAPDANKVAAEMEAFITWFNNKQNIDPVLKSAIAHLWFVTIHPFADGNGRIARAIADMQLSRADETAQRFYSMSSQIRQERNMYYSMLENTQKSDLDITEWLEWFFSCLERTIDNVENTLQKVNRKVKFWKNAADIELNSRQRLMLNKLLDGFEGKLNSSKWAKITKASPDTSLRDITDLINKGILVKSIMGGRSTNYQLNLL
ncbi:MAG: Fic family protein [Bacteroidota bacterium]